MIKRTSITLSYITRSVLVHLNNKENLNQAIFKLEVLLGTIVTYILENIQLSVRKLSKKVTGIAWKVSRIIYIRDE